MRPSATLRDVVKTAVKKIVPDQLLGPLLRSPFVVKLRRYPLSGEVYYCRALQGDSNYNICINSDMTVSCNCYDYDGNGHIGDLNNQTLDQIFHGEIAERFRRRLARGWLPIPECSRCKDLQTIKRRDADHYLMNYHVPWEGIMVENTSLCNLNCTHCDRDKVMKIRKKTRMSLEDMERVSQTIRDFQIKTVFFHNLGDPFFSKTIFEEMCIMRKHNPDVRIYTSTNGLLLDSEKKREAALLMDHVFISIDGPSQELVARYQIGGDFRKSYENMKKLVDFRNSKNILRPVIDWKYVVFSWNDGEDAIEKAIELAREAGVDFISFWLGIGSPIEMSQRYLHDPYFQRLGVRSWKGREIDLRRASGRKNALKLQN